MNSLLRVPKVSEEELEYYGEIYVQQQIRYKEQITFEHYLYREIMLKHRQQSLMARKLYV